MNYINFTTWKEFFDAYMWEDGRELNDFENLCCMTDVCERLSDNKWLNGYELFNLYNSSNKINIDYDKLEMVNPDQYDLLVEDIDTGIKYSFPVCSPDDEFGEVFYIEN